MITKVNHIGIAVKSLDESLKLYTQVLGLKLKGIETLPDGKTRTALIPVGDSEIELLESLDPESPIGKFVERQGEGLHHIAFEVSDINQTMKSVVDKGLRMIDEKPRKGVENTTIAFIHPKSTKVLMELVQS